MPNDFGDRLRELRSRKNLTLADLARKAGVSVSYLSQLEAGVKSKLSAVLLNRLANTFGVSMDSLFGRQSSSEVEFDADGYPTEESLSAIGTYHTLAGEQFASRGAELLARVLRAWRYPLAWRTELVDGNTVVTCSTLGWSGNECLIQALQANVGFWRLHWQFSRRGGHFGFEFNGDQTGLFPEAACQS